MKQSIGQFIVETDRARTRRDYWIALVWRGAWLHFMAMGKSEPAVYDAAYAYAKRWNGRADED